MSEVGTRADALPLTSVDTEPAVSADVLQQLDAIVGGSDRDAHSKSDYDLSSDGESAPRAASPRQRTAKSPIGQSAADAQTSPRLREEVQHRFEELLRRASHHEAEQRKVFQQAKSQQSRSQPTTPRSQAATPRASSAVPRSPRSAYSSKSSATHDVFSRLYSLGMAQKAHHRTQQEIATAERDQGPAPVMTPRSRMTSAGRFRDAYDPQVDVPMTPENYGSMLYQEALKLRAAKLRAAEEARLRRMEEEVVGATFKPILSHRGAKQPASAPGEVYDRLYNLGKAHFTYIEMLTKQRKEEELAELSFHPQTVKPPNSVDLSTDQEIHTRLYHMGMASMRHKMEESLNQRSRSPDATFHPTVSPKAAKMERSREGLFDRLYEHGKTLVQKRNTPSAEATTRPTPTRAASASRPTTPRSTPATPRSAAPTPTKSVATPRSTGAAPRSSAATPRASAVTPRPTTVTPRARASPATPQQAAPAPRPTSAKQSPLPRVAYLGSPGGRAAALAAAAQRAASPIVVSASSPRGTKTSYIQRALSSPIPTVTVESD